MYWYLEVKNVRQLHEPIKPWERLMLCWLMVQNIKRSSSLL